MKHTYILAFAALLCSCVSATAEVESVCSDKGITLPAAPVGVSAIVGEQTVTQSVEEDLSDTLSKVADVADVSLLSFRLDLSGNVSFIKRVRVTLQSDKSPDLVLSDSVVVQSGDVLNVPFTGDLSKLQSALTAGKVTLKVDVTGLIPETETTLSSTLCVGVSGKVEKSL